MQVNVECALMAALKAQGKSLGKKPSRLRRCRVCPGIFCIRQPAEGRLRALGQVLREDVSA